MPSKKWKYTVTRNLCDYPSNVPGWRQWMIGPTCTIWWKSCRSPPCDLGTMVWGQYHNGSLEPVLSTVRSCFEQEYTLHIHKTSTLPCHDWTCKLKLWYACHGEHVLPGIFITRALASNIIAVKLKLILLFSHHRCLPRNACPWDAEPVYSAAVTNAWIPGTTQVMDGA